MRSSSASSPSCLSPLHRYWELGERAQAQIASKITPCSTRCLHSQLGRGRGRGPCNVMLRGQKNQGCPGITMAHSSKEIHHFIHQRNAQIAAADMSECHLSAVSTLYLVYHMEEKFILHVLLGCRAIKIQGMQDLFITGYKWITSGK